MKENQKLLAEEALEKSLSKGADSADIVIARNFSKNIGCRLGKLEEVEQSETQILGLRTFIGHRSAIISTSNLSKESVDESIERVIEMTKLAPEDSFVSLVKSTAEDIQDLDLYDDYDLSPNQLKDLALEAENESLKSKKITNSNGASSSQSKTSLYLATTSGFSSGYKKSNFSVSCSVIAGNTKDMQTDYDYDSKIHFKDLKDSSALGQKAAENAIAKCNSRKIETCVSDIVFDPKVSRTILSHFSSLINGSSVARGSSFLCESMNKNIFSEEINIIDDPKIPRGLASRPFDDEGCDMEKINIIKNGILKSWILDSTTAKQLNLKSNSRASRGMSSPPSPSSTNMFIENGSKSVAEIIGSISDGFYVTDLIGQGVNLITGDYSRGAAGFKIKDGKISFPINEVTIAGNLKDMFSRMLPANDLEFKYSINSPTIFIEGMTIAGI